MVTDDKRVGRSSVNFKDLAGKKFGMLTVTGLSVEKGTKGLKWDCICECGKIPTPKLTYQLTSGKTQSCGCLHKARAREANRGASRYKLSEDQLLSRLHGLPVKLLEYAGKVNDKSTLQCTVDGCGHIWSSKLRAIYSGRGCPACAKAGFNPKLKSDFYVYEIYSQGAMYIGFGITNRWRRREVEHALQLKRCGATWNVLFVISMAGVDAQKIESTIKRTLPIVDTGIPGFKTEATPYTEEALAEILLTLNLDKVPKKGVAS